MSGTRARRLGALALTLVSAGAMTWLSLRWLELKPLPSAGARPQAEVVLEGAELTAYGPSGQRSWTLRAAHLGVDEQTLTTTARQVEVRFWQEERLALLVRAGRLTFDNVRRDLRFEDGLEAEGPRGLRFATSAARWNHRERALEGDAPVRVSQGDLWIEGTGFRFDARTGRFLVRQGAHLRWSPEAP